MFKVGDRVRRTPSTENWLWDKATKERGENFYGVFTVSSAAPQGSWIMFDGYPYRWRVDKFELVQSHLSDVTMEDFL